MWASSGVNLSVAMARLWLVEMLDATIDLARFWVKKALGVAVTLLSAVMPTAYHPNPVEEIRPAIVCLLLVHLHVIPALNRVE